MIKIESKKLRNVIHKDGNKLSVRKTYQINKFEITHCIKPGITLYIKSMEELELYKNEETWCMGCVIDGGAYLIASDFSENNDPNFQTSIKQALHNMNRYFTLANHKKYILLRVVNENITIPNCKF